MKAIIVSKHGGPEALDLKEIDIPKPKSNEVVIKNSFVGINYIDIYHRTGLYPLELPLILGREAAGIIEKLGSEVNGDFKIGDRVAYFSPHAYAAYTTVPMNKVVLLPSDIELDIAAASILQGSTAIMIQQISNVQPHHVVLIHAAAGGVGLLLVQLCHFIGAKVIATVSTKEKSDLVMKMGASNVLNYKELDQKELIRQILEFSDGKGCDVIMDGVGKDTFQLDLDVCNFNACLCSFGNASGKVPLLDIMDLSKKNVKICRPSLVAFLAKDEDYKFWSNKLWSLISEKGLKVRVFKTYNFDQVALAHKDLESRATIGKLLLKI